MSDKKELIGGVPPNPDRLQESLSPERFEWTPDIEMKDFEERIAALVPQEEPNHTRAIAAALFAAAVAILAILTRR